MGNLNLNYNRIRLNIGDFEPRSGVVGPGKRFVIWVQGCSLKCPQCINPQFLSHNPKRIMSVSELYKLIIATPDIEGATYSGGEPFEQAKGLYYLSRLLRKKGLTIISYSGYTYEELVRKKDRYTSGLLSNLDILIDGRFEADKAATLLWRGSRNQRVHFLTERYREYENLINREDVAIELAIGSKSVSLTGNFDRRLLGKIKNRLKKGYGVILK